MSPAPENDSPESRKTKKSIPGKILLAMSKFTMGVFLNKKTRRGNLPGLFEKLLRLPIFPDSIYPYSLVQIRFLKK